MGAIRELRKEIRELKSQLPLDVLEDYRKMEAYLKLSSVHGLDLEQGKKEILGMLLEAEKRGGREEVLGENREAFLRAVIENSRKRTAEEYTSMFFFIFFLELLIYWTAIWFFTSRQPVVELTSLNVITAGCVAFMNVIILCAESRMTYKSATEQACVSGGIMAVTLVVLILLGWMPTVVLTEVFWCVPMVVFAFASTSSYLWMEKASEKENLQD